MPMWLQNQTQFAFCSLASAWLALFSHFLVKARATVLHGLVGQQPLEAALDRDRNRRRLLRGIGVLVVLGLVGDSALGVVGVLLGLVGDSALGVIGALVVLRLALEISLGLRGISLEFFLVTEISLRAGLCHILTVATVNIIEHTTNCSSRRRTVVAVAAGVAQTAAGASGHGTIRYATDEAHAIQVDVPV